MRKIIIVVVFLWGHFSVKALETKMEIRPERPVVGESFQIIIHVYSDKQERPDVFLNFGGLDRISESISKGVEATIVRGQLTSSITHSFIYEVSASTAKTYVLNNISVSLTGEKKRLSNKVISVLKEAPQAKNFFLLAQASKEKFI